MFLELDSSFYLLNSLSSSAGTNVMIFRIVSPMQLLKKLAKKTLLVYTKIGAEHWFHIKTSTFSPKIGENRPKW
jgi:hypothetical protein